MIIWGSRRTERRRIQHQVISKCPKEMLNYMCSLPAKNWEVRDNIKRTEQELRGNSLLGNHIKFLNQRRDTFTEQSLLTPPYPATLHLGDSTLKLLSVWGSFLPSSSPLHGARFSPSRSLETPELKQWEERGDRNMVNIPQKLDGKSNLIGWLRCSHHLLFFGNNRSCSIY